MPFSFKKLEIPDVVLVTPKSFGDERGFFLESYKHSDFAAFGITDQFNQDNHSRSSKGILRGLHYQLRPKGQAKLVRCVNGKILDVAVDIRKNSPSFGKWVSEILSDENKNMLYIPEGFAHGFVVLSDTADLLYKATNEFSLEHDRGIRWNDPDINIEWKIDFDPLVSAKDAALPFLKDAQLS